MSALAHVAAPHDFQADIDLVGGIEAIPTILAVACRVSGMGFAAVARVTEDRWVACRVKDEISFGLRPGDELEVASTICHEIRQSRTPVVIDHVAADAAYCDHPTPARYGFQSYVSMPIVLPDGTFFGTLCAIDPKPASVDRPEVVGTFRMFADLIAFHVDAHRRNASANDAIRSEAFVRGILAASPDCVKVLSAEGRLEYMNERGLDLIQLGSLQDVLGRELADLWPDSERARIRTAVRTAASGVPSRTEGYCPTAKGEPRWWEVSFAPFRVEGTGELKLVGVSRDITERVRAEEERRESAAALEALNTTLADHVEARTQERDRIWQVSHDMLGVADGKGVWVSVNPAWTAILGWQSGEVIGRTSEWLEHPDDRAATRAEVARLAAGQTTLAFENRFRTRDGGYRILSWRAVPVEGLLYCVARDVTEQRERTMLLEQAEEALRQSQKLEAVGQLTGGVAHDFNNLLTIIRSSVDFLRRPNLPEERRNRYMDAVSDTVDRAAKLTGQLLAFARRQTLKPEVLEVGAQLRAVADMLDTVTGARIRVVTEAPDAPCFVRADLSQFETALINMAVNARDAMEGEGTLTLRLDCAEGMPPIRGHAAAPGFFAAVSVVDTGCGIAAEQVGRIFEPFFTTKPVGQGTGLGLSQVFGFAKQSGGDVDVTSELGRGTTFTLYLPEVEGVIRDEPSEVRDGEAFPTGDGQCVLVVEDNVEVGRFATQILEDFGYRTTWAANAEEALEKLGSDGAGFDAVFSDVVMPGMGGFELAKILQRRLPHLPVLLASGYSHVLAQDGPDGFELLHKPYSADQLGRILGKIVPSRVRRGSSSESR
ncbi:PAS domain-containing protein [Methylorubrum sp. GM97]|uniref:PAS domain-containing protein n=1 Tax=Methylorubrum sp. GM97 TaxID=2938232 RepID=UPI002186F94C|nr:PAS domain-containing protein [Methylorubrum sp. GM97]BDL39078.1 hybrid sensor histidine kinase/response regulator [Methylorubrum sp. GM97]